ncbi:DUF58 domain-containing protein [Umezawaea sp. NPDC059074]|uniref:DUF58 domain-containing protein n=1 Tax=Umezawaea sp. NPDC059074 TaxID=3346716 RepID=UPI00369C3A12
MRLTTRGVALIVCGIALFAAGSLLGHQLVQALGGAALAVVVGAALLAAGRLRVDVEREIHPDRVEAGTTALARVVVRNPGSRRIPGFAARDPWPGGFETVRVRSLASGTTASHSYELPTERRGKVPIGPMTLLRDDALGLVRNRITVGPVTDLHVHPKVRQALVSADGRAHQHHEGPVRTTSMRGSADLRALRDYVVGDEPRHVHWKASARLGKLVVRDMVDPDEPGFTVLLDDRVGALTPEAFEEAVEVAASLAHASALTGERTRLCTTAGLDVDTAGGVPAGLRLLDFLCEVGQAESTGPVDRLVSTGQVGGTLVFVSGGTAASDLRDLSALSRCARGITVIDVAGNEYVDAVAGVPRIGAATAIGAIKTWNSGVRV